MLLTYLFCAIIALTMSCVAPEAFVEPVRDAGIDSTLGDVGNDDLGGAPDRDADETFEMGPDQDSPDAGGLRDEALLFALRRDAESVFIALGYNAARDAMYLDGGVEDQAGRVECLYTGRSVDTDGTRVPSMNCARADGTAISCAFNTEHTVPRGDLRDAFGEGTPQYIAAEGDLHHLFPSDERANNARANFDFGLTDCAANATCAFDEQSQLGVPTGGRGPTNCPGGVDPGEDLCVMQVRPERRGDVARAVFYMAMRYELELSEAVETELRAWHEADPPDVREVTRNEAAAAVQGNRNPFVDAPHYVDRIASF